MKHRSWKRVLAGVVATSGTVALSVSTLIPAAGAISGTWTPLAPVPQATEGMSVAGVGNLVVAAYGDSPSLGGDTDLTRIYNISTDSWSSGATAPGGPSAEGIAVAQSGNVYTLGGRDGSHMTMLNRYTPATDTWATLAPMSTGRDGLGAAVVGGGIYAIGGRDTGGGPCSGTFLASVERYDVLTNTWASVAPLPTPTSDAGAISSGGKIYVFGGCVVNSAGAVVVTHNVEIYDPTTNTWSSGSPMPTARAGFYGVGIVGSNIYVMGGVPFPFASVTTSANEVYSVPTDSWSSATPMLHPRGEMGVASHGGRIYTVGGSLPAYGNSVDTNDVFTP